VQRKAKGDFKGGAKVRNTEGRKHDIEEKELKKQNARRTRGKRRSGIRGAGLRCSREVPAAVQTCLLIQLVLCL